MSGDGGVSPLFLSYRHAAPVGPHNKGPRVCSDWRNHSIWENRDDRQKQVPNLLEQKLQEAVRIVKNQSQGADWTHKQEQRTWYRVLLVQLIGRYGTRFSGCKWGTGPTYP